MIKPGAQVAAKLAGKEDFSVFLGGPVDQLLHPARPPQGVSSATSRRILLVALVGWLPLLLIAIAEGAAFGGVAIPFLLDAEAHVRFLVVVPLLIAGQAVVHERVRSVTYLFIERRIIAGEGAARFQAAIASAYRWRDSSVPVVLIIVFVYTIGILVIWRQFVVIDTPTWYATPTEHGTQISLAGIWLAAVSLPMFQFLLIQWYFRIFLWARFLWQVSRLPLGLIPMHPDRVGGLGFLSLAIQGFFVLAAAHGALLAAYLADRTLHLGASLPSFMFEIGGVILFVQVVTLAPLLVFAPQLARAKRIGTQEYGSLAASYVRAFDTKWLRGGAAADEAFLGSPDVQSLADLSNSLDIVNGMRFVPITKEDAFRLAIVTALPVAPLLLTMMPLDQLLRHLVGILF